MPPEKQVGLSATEEAGEIISLKEVEVITGELEPEDTGMKVSKRTEKESEQLH